ncbi:MAG: thioesterase family protein [Solirubrobacteraceae bacterium]
MSQQAIFVHSGERFAATELARGPWDLNAQHGGAPAALLMRAFEALGSGDDLRLARVSYELLRPVPLGELEVTAEVARCGRRVWLLEGSIATPDGTELVRARAVRVRRAELQAGLEPRTPTPRAHQHGRANDYDRGAGPMFATDAMEIRFVEGSFSAPGPATAWFRLRVPLVAGQPTSPLQRLAAAADFPNGISAVVPWDEYLFINPDLTIYIEREPVGEWICLQARTRVHDGGSGIAEAMLFDQRGRVGTATQSLLVARR